MYREILSHDDRISRSSGIISQQESIILSDTKKFWLYRIRFASRRTVLADFNEYANGFLRSLLFISCSVYQSTLFPASSRTSTHSISFNSSFRSLAQVEHGIETCKLVQSCTAIGAAPPMLLRQAGYYSVFQTVLPTWWIKGQSFHSYILNSLRVHYN